MARPRGFTAGAGGFCGVLAAFLLPAVFLTACHTPTVAPPPPPAVAGVSSETLTIPVVDYQRVPAANVKLGTDQPIALIAPTDDDGNTAISYRSLDHLRVFVLNVDSRATAQVARATTRNQQRISRPGEPLCVWQALPAARRGSKWAGRATDPSGPQFYLHDRLVGLNDSISRTVNPGEKLRYDTEYMLGLLVTPVSVTPLVPSPE